MIMPAKGRDTAETEQRDPPGKPQSQIDAEAPPDAATAAAWQAEYDSRMPPAETAPAAEETAGDEPAGNPRDWKPRGKAQD